MYFLNFEKQSRQSAHIERQHRAGNILNQVGTTSALVSFRSSRRTVKGRFMSRVFRPRIYTRISATSAIFNRTFQFPPGRAPFPFTWTHLSKSLAVTSGTRGFRTIQARTRDIFIKLVALPSSPFAMISKTEQTFVPGYQLGFLIRATWQPAHIVFLVPSILHDLHHRFASPVPGVAGA